MEEIGIIHSIFHPPQLGADSSGDMYLKPPSMGTHDLVMLGTERMLMRSGDQELARAHLEMLLGRGNCQAEFE